MEVKKEAKTTYHHVRCSKEAYDQIVYITGKSRQFYQAMSTYELAVELKIAKLQTGLV
ncbi:TPA: hypothetical protein ACGO6G_001201 [Streptococcus suis]